MQYHEAELIASAADREQWPDSELPEIIFAGRSNAGKSSLINTLVNRKQLAYTGSTPGKTKLLNFFRIDNSMVFTDAPGYGYAKGGDNTALMFANLIDPYFAEREQLKGLVLVLDIRRTPNEDDHRMVEYAKNTGLALVAVCMKADKLSRNQQINQLRLITKELDIPFESAIPVSSIKRTGVDTVWEDIKSMCE